MAVVWCFTPKTIVFEAYRVKLAEAKPMSSATATEM